jgi:hypothetical protein
VYKTLRYDPPTCPLHQPRIFKDPRFYLKNAKEISTKCCDDLTVATNPLVVCGLTEKDNIDIKDLKSASKLKVVVEPVSAINKKMIFDETPASTVSSPKTFADYIMNAIFGFVGTVCALAVGVLLKLLYNRFFRLRPPPRPLHLRNLSPTISSPSTISTPSPNVLNTPSPNAVDTPSLYEMEDEKFQNLETRYMETAV